MILIVGGAGYIGSHVNKLLHKKGYQTIVLDNLMYGHSEFVKWGNFQLGDIGNYEFLNLLLKKYKIDAVMHFAGFTYVGESVENPQKYYMNNVKNTMILLQAMLENNVHNFIFSSTCATYGMPLELPLVETHAQNPINPYGQTKLFIEKIMNDYSKSYDFNFVALRYFNAAGADPDSEIGEWHEPETHLIPLVLDAAMNIRENIKIYGTDYPTKDGTCIRDYIHVNDLADAHILALEYLLNGGKSDFFNLGNGEGFSVREIIEVSKKITGKSIKEIEIARREGDPAILVGSANKAKEILKWKPQFADINTIIKTAWEWHNYLYLNFKNYNR